MHDGYEVPNVVWGSIATSAGFWSKKNFGVGAASVDLSYFMKTYKSSTGRGQQEAILYAVPPLANLRPLNRRILAFPLLHPQARSVRPDQLYRIWLKNRDLLGFRWNG